MRGPAQSRNPARVLVVDDYRPLADMLVKMLEARGHDARVAYDGATALAVAEEFQPQALIADVFMKDMDGFKLAAEFNRRFPGCRVLLTPCELFLEYPLEAGNIHKLLTEPVDTSELVRFVEFCVDGHAGADSPKDIS